MSWQPIETAPKDGTVVDLLAKTWDARRDTFRHQRFPDCRWWKGDDMTNTRAQWMNLHEQWYPTHWMPLPDPPMVTK